MFKSIIFVQGQEATKWLDLLAESGTHVVVKHMLAEFDWEGRRDDLPLEDELPAGELDTIDWVDDFALIYNFRVGYIGLAAQVYAVEGIFDNQGKTMDRYRISLEGGGGFYAARDTGPRGVFMFDDSAHGLKREGEIETEWSDLPESVRSALRAEHVIPPEEGRT